MSDTPNVSQVVPAVSGCRGRDVSFHLSLALAVVAMLLCVRFDADPKNDVATCYARQAREFAVGNWPGAFFHMSPPVVPTLGGMLVVLGLPPFAALKVVSAAFFVAGLWPLRRLLRRVLPVEVASWGCVLYAIAPRLVRYSGAGLLESAKVFFLLWGVVLTLEQVERRRPITAVWVGVCAAGLCLARGEGVFLLPLFVAYLLLLPAWQCWRDAGEPGARLRRLMSEALVSVRLLGLSGMVCLLLCVPQLLYIRAVTGYAALDSRQAAVVQRTLVQLRLTEAGDAESAAAKYMESTRQGQPRRDARAEDTVTLGRNLREAVKGLDLFILGLALVGLGPRLYRRQAGVDDLVAAGVILYNTALFAGVGYITKRYTMPTMPFLLGWSAAGVSILRQRLFLRLPASAFRNTVAVVVGVSLWHGLSSVRARWGARQPDPACEFGRWLAPRRAALTKAQPVRLVSDAGGLDYHDGRQPIVAATYPQYAFWAAADYVGIPHDRLMDVDELRRLLAEKQVDLLVVDDDLRLTCPDFRPDVPWLDPVPDTPANAGFRVFRVRRGIRTSEDQ